jgi:hypothetical protein
LSWVPDAGSYAIDGWEFITVRDAAIRRLCVAQS